MIIDVKKFIMTIMFSLCLSQAAMAAEPAADGSVKGCDWVATIQKVGMSNGALSAALRLDTEKGNCKLHPGPCGDKGQIVYAPLGDRSPDDFEAGQRVDVWVAMDTATLDIPACAHELLDNQQ